MKYTIPESKRTDIEKLVNRFAKKAKKYGKAFSVKCGEPYATEVAVYDIGYDPLTGASTKVLDHTMMVEAFDIEIEADIIQNDGYTVVAQVEHLEGGNIVNVFDGDIKAEWIHSDCRCEHCKTNRTRKLTYIVRKGNEELQVGKTCLKDYCGIDPQLMGLRNQLTDILLNEDVDHYDFAKGGVEWAYDTTEILALAIRAYKKQGYIKSEMPNSNKDFIREMVDSNVHPTEEEVSRAAEMAKVIEGLDDKDAINFLLNDTRTLVRTTYCKRSHFGYIAYAPVAFEKYRKEMAKKAELEAEHQKQMASEYVGEVGKRQTFDIAEFKLVTSWEGQFGITYLYKFTDTNGNVLVWFASGCFGHWIEVDGVCKFVEEENVSRIKATVKDHNERDGVKQTIINRVKVA